MIKITDIVKGNTANFSFYRDGKMYYEIITPKTKYIFPVNVLEESRATFLNQDKAIFFMKWIRLAIESENLVVV